MNLNINFSKLKQRIKDINKMDILVKSIQICMSERVPYPITKKWLESHKSILLKILDRIKSADADIFLFIKAQFALMDKNFCTRTFKILYPPLPTFTTANAINRYIVYVRSMGYNSKELKLNVKQLIDRDNVIVNAMGGIKDEFLGRIELAIRNGILSKHWCYYAIHTSSKFQIYLNTHFPMLVSKLLASPKIVVPVNKLLDDGVINPRFNDE